MGYRSGVSAPHNASSAWFARESGRGQGTMDRKPEERKPGRFQDPRPNTIQQAWQRMHRPGEEADAWLTSEKVPTEGSATDRHDWPALPLLPKWPPLPEESPLGGGHTADTTSAPPGAAGGEAQLAAQLPPESPPGWPGVARRSSRTPVDRFRSSSRQAQVGMAGATAVVLVLAVLLGSAVLGSVFRAGTARTGDTSPNSAQAGTGTPAASSVLPTPTASSHSGTPSPLATTTTAPLTITLTCASAASGKGTVCVHTEPSATVSLSVRYCDGTSAKGLQGAAHADGNGDYTWQWQVHTTCASATATVTAKASRQSATQSQVFSITN